MASKYSFLQFDNSVIQTVDTTGATVTFSLGAQPDPTVRIQNLSTATIWIGMGSQSTSSAAVTTKGVMLAPDNRVGCLQILRTGGNLKVALFAVGATQTSSVLVTGGDGGTVA